MDRYCDVEPYRAGAHALVFTATDNMTNNNVVLKRISLGDHRELTPSMLRECLILSELNHQNIIRLDRVFVDGAYLYLAIEMMTGDLREHLTVYEEKYNNENTIKSFLKQILMGLSYCHSNGILHRDLKPENVLYNNDQLKITDFGSARGFLAVPPVNLTPALATVEYGAPEVLMGSTEYSKAADIWSVGCMFAEMLNLTPLFEHVSGTAADVLEKIFSFLGTPTDDILPGVSALAFPQHVPQDLGTLVPRLGGDVAGKDLLSRMLSLDPRERISAEDALQHEYLAGI